MYHILKYNNIAKAGLEQFDEHYQIADTVEQPDAIILRSENLHAVPVAKSVRVIARAGAGTNNIPVEKMTELGIPVLNTPGANANAVKELVLTGMFLACRNICKAWDFARQIEGNDKELSHSVEQGKKQFQGFELPNRTLGIIGLGKIGVRVANAALALGMKVKGFDPNISVENAWQLSADVTQASSIADVIKSSDFLTIHVPLNDHTRGLLNKENLSLAKDGMVLLNFARGGIIERQALVELINSEKIGVYVTDFPSTELRDLPGVISLPHLGASTREAEENCAVMAATQIKNFLEQGTIKHSVNFPAINLPCAQTPRLAIVNANVPNMVAQITNVLSNEKINIIDMINKSRDQIAFTLIDVDQKPGQQALTKLEAINGVIRVSLIEPKG
jgi:D-3-phosphoglycerate dehydrogenase / 2-oxoglutarate reductase